MKFTSLVAGTLLGGSAGVVGFQARKLASPGSFRVVPPTLGTDRRGSGESRKRDGTSTTVVLDAHITEGSFQQLINHSDPSLGTFTQRFWWAADHYGGHGSPVVLFTPTSRDASLYIDYASNATIVGQIAQAVGGAAIVYESRYTGESTPFTWYSTANLSHQTIRNHALDATYLAKNIQLPFDPNRTSTPDKAAWIFVGGGISASVSAWTKTMYSGTFWAHVASSALVETITDWWTYYEAPQTYGPANCTADVNKVIDYMDSVLESGLKQDIHALKDKFGFGELAHSVDMMSALAQGPQSWQDWMFSDAYYNKSRAYYDWCDYVENVWPGSGNKTPGAEGVGLEKALDGYAKWSKEVLIPNYCKHSADALGVAEWKGETNVQCFDTFNASSPIYTDLSYKHNGDSLSYFWLACNEPLEWWQNGPPKGTPALVSRLINTKYWRRQCALTFPPQNNVSVGVSTGKTADDVDAMTGGWDLWDIAIVKRILFSVGEFEMSRSASVSAKERPNGPLNGTDLVPVFVSPGAPACSDLITAEGLYNPGPKALVEKELAIMKGWVQEFYKEHNITRDFVYK